MMYSHSFCSTSYWSYWRRYHHSSSKKKNTSDKQEDTEDMKFDNIENIIISKLIDAPNYITLHRFIEQIPTENQRGLRKAYDIKPIDGMSYGTGEGTTYIVYNNKDANGIKKEMIPCYVFDVKNITSLRDESATAAMGSKYITGRYCLVMTTGLSENSSWKVTETAEEVKDMIEKAVKKRQEEILELMTKVNAINNNIIENDEKEQL